MTIGRCCFVLRITQRFCTMIVTFTHRGLERFFEIGTRAGINPQHATRLRLILSALDSAAVIDDMDIPGFGLHPLQGNMGGKWSVSVNANWRVIFEFLNGNAHLVDYLDYH